MDLIRLLSNDTFIGFFNAIAAIGYVYVVIYGLRMAKNECSCAKSWKQDFLYYSSVVLAMASMLVVFVCARGDYGKFLLKYPNVDTVLFITSITYVVIGWLHIRELEKEKCTCSDGLHLIMVYVIKLIIGLLLSYGIFVGIVIVIAWASLRFIKNK